MATVRQANLLGQMRLDVPHIRAIESAVAADFDIFAGRIVGGGQALVVRGFEVVMDTTIGNPATDVEVNVEDGILMHYTASENGTLFTPAVGSTTERIWSGNTNVSGAWSTGVNYLGLDLFREADDTTSDTVAFIDPDTDEESLRTVPLARTLSYRFIVSSSPFSQTLSILPIAKVTVNSSGNVTAVEDARQMLFRLGTGGTSPDTAYSFPWASTRNEETDTTLDTFSGGDKTIQSMKDWMNAVMTAIWECKGGPYWYSAGDKHGNRLVRDYDTGSIHAATGDHFLWDGTNLLWKGLSVQFANSGVAGVYQNQITDQTTPSAQTNLVAGECLYVDLDKTSNATITAKKGVLASLGEGAVPGSRYVLAWNPGGNVMTADGRPNEGSAYAWAYSLTETLALTPTATPLTWTSAPKLRKVTIDGTYKNFTPSNNRTNAESPWKFSINVIAKAQAPFVGAPTDIVVELFKNGVLVTGASATVAKAAALAAGDIYTFAISHIEELVTHSHTFSVRARCNGTSMNLDITSATFTMERISLT